MLRRGLGWLVSLLLGMLVGYVLVMLVAPKKGKPFRQGMIQSYQRAQAAATSASQQRRAELEAELARLRGDRP
ncbi:MAG: hypothetical protein ACOYLB_15545 [Phototrophicaceae bacterium]